MGVIYHRVWSLTAVLQIDSDLVFLNMFVSISSHSRGSNVWPKSLSQLLFFFPQEQTHWESYRALIWHLYLWINTHRCVQIGCYAFGILRCLCCGKSVWFAFILLVQRGIYCVLIGVGRKFKSWDPDLKDWNVVTPAPQKKETSVIEGWGKIWVTYEGV